MDKRICSPSFADPARVFDVDLFDSTSPADWRAVTNQAVELPWRTARAETTLEAGGVFRDFIRLWTCVLVIANSDLHVATNTIQ